MDETREQLLQERRQRGEPSHATSAQDVYDAIQLRAVMARQFYMALRELEFTREEAVTITAGQHF